MANNSRHTSAICVRKLSKLAELVWLFVLFGDGSSRLSGPSISIAERVFKEKPYVIKPYQFYFTYRSVWRKVRSSTKYRPMGSWISSSMRFSLVVSWHHVCFTGRRRRLEVHEPYLFWNFMGHGRKYLGICSQSLSHQFDQISAG